MKQQDKAKLGRRDFLRAMGAGAGLAVTAAAPLATAAAAVESDVDKNMLAVSGLSILGKSQAGPAVPALVEIVRTGGGERTSGYNNVTFPMLALADLDPEAATKAGIQFGTNGTIIGWSAPPAAANK